LRLRPDQLPAHLRQTLASLYLVFGEEPLQARDAADAVRAAARERGCQERECLTVEAGFDWGGLRQHAASRSLFTTRRLLELRLGNSKPGDAGAKALAEYAARPAADAVLLLTAGKLDGQTQKSRWFAALEGAGIVVQASPVEAGQWRGWIERRLRSCGLNPTADAVKLLAERVEGNLLAAEQEIERLALLVTDRELTAAVVRTAVGDSARYSIYEWVDAALLARPERVTRILDNLRREGVEPVLVNWALQQEVRRLAMLAFARSRQQSLEAVLAELKVWEKRKALLRQTLQRLSLENCRVLLRACADTDQVIKGVVAGSAWDALLTNGLRLAGLEWLPDEMATRRRVQ